MRRVNYQVQHCPIGVLSEKVCKFYYSPALFIGNPNKREDTFAMKN